MDQALKNYNLTQIPKHDPPPPTYLELFNQHEKYTYTACKHNKSANAPLYHNLTIQENF